MSSRLLQLFVQRDGRVFVQAYSRAENGPRVADGLPEVVASIDDASAVGAAVVAGLHRSNAQILPAVDLRDPSLGQETWEWAGVNSWAEYTRGVRGIAVAATFNENLGEVSLEPQHKEGARGGYRQIGDAIFTVTYESDEQLGHAVQEALELSTL